MQGQIEKWHKTIASRVAVIFPDNHAVIIMIFHINKTNTGNKLKVADNTPLLTIIFGRRHIKLQNCPVAERRQRNCCLAY